MEGNKPDSDKEEVTPIRGKRDEKRRKTENIQVGESDFPMGGISGPDKAVCKKVKSGKVEKRQERSAKTIEKNFRHKDIPCILLDNRLIGQLIVLKNKAAVVRTMVVLFILKNRQEYSSHRQEIHWQSNQTDLKSRLSAFPFPKPNTNPFPGRRNGTPSF